MSASTDSSRGSAKANQRDLSSSWLRSRREEDYKCAEHTDDRAQEIPPIRHDAFNDPKPDQRGSDVYSSVRSVRAPSVRCLDACEAQREEDQADDSRKHKPPRARQAKPRPERETAGDFKERGCEENSDRPHGCTSPPLVDHSLVDAICNPNWLLRNVIAVWTLSIHLTSPNARVVTRLNERRSRAAKVSSWAPISPFPGPPLTSLGPAASSGAPTNLAPNRRSSRLCNRLQIMHLIVDLPSHSAQKARHCECGGHGARRLERRAS